MEYTAEDYILFIEIGRRDKISPEALQVIAKRFRENVDKKDSEITSLKQEVKDKDAKLIGHMKESTSVIFNLKRQIEDYKKQLGDLFYCQSSIEGRETCADQCDHCKEYFKPLESLSTPVSEAPAYLKNESEVFFAQLRIADILPPLDAVQKRMFIEEVEKLMQNLLSYKLPSTIDEGEIERMAEAVFDKIKSEGGYELSDTKSHDYFIDGFFEGFKKASSLPWNNIQEKLPDLNEEYLVAIDFEDGQDSLGVFAAEFNTKTKEWVWSNTEEKVQGTVLFWKEKDKAPQIKWKRIVDRIEPRTLSEMEGLAYGQCVHLNNLANCPICNDDDNAFFIRDVK